MLHSQIRKQLEKISETNRLRQKVSLAESKLKRIVKYLNETLSEDSSLKERELFKSRKIRPNQVSKLEEFQIKLQDISEEDSPSRINTNLKNIYDSLNLSISDNGEPFQKQVLGLIQDKVKKIAKSKGYEVSETISGFPVLKLIKK